MFFNGLQYTCIRRDGYVIHCTDSHALSTRNAPRTTRATTIGNHWGEKRQRLHSVWWIVLSTISRCRMQRDSAKVWTHPTRILEIWADNGHVFSSQESSHISNFQNVSIKSLEDWTCSLAHRNYRVVKDVVMPLSTPIKGVDGKPIHEVFVPKGTDIYIASYACNRNPALWGEDAHEWKPERWLSPLPGAVTDARIPGIYSNL